MSGINLVTPSESLDDDLRKRYRDRHVVRTVWSDAWPSPAAAVFEIAAAAPEVVVLGPELGRDDAMDLLIELDRTQPGIGVIVLIADPANEDILEFLRNGARNVLDDGTESEGIGTAIDELVELVEQRRSNFGAASTSKRRVLAFMSPKGGTGKTTLSTNLAVGMAKRAPNRVLLVDLDVQFGDAAAALGLDPEFSLANTAGLGSMDRASLKVFLSIHASTLGVLSPPDDFAQAEALDVQSVKGTLASLSDEFPYLILDTAGGIDDYSLLALEFATDLLFVTTTDAASIRAVKRQLDALDELGLMGHRRHFILNRSDTKAGLSLVDIEATLGMRAIAEIPVSRSIPLSSNQGIPLLDGDTRDAAARSLEKLVDYFMPETTEASKRGFRLFGRKD